jgi:hypothetical protein
VRCSLVPAEVGLVSPREIRLARRGIASWAAAILISMLTYLSFLVITLCSAPFWDALREPGSLPRYIHLLSWRAYSYSCFVAVPLQAVAVVLIAGATLKVRDAGRGWLPWTIGVAAAMSAGGIVYTTAAFFAQLPTLGQPSVNMPVSYTSQMLFGVVTLVAWVSLMSRLGRGQRRTWTMMWPGFAVLAMHLARGVIGSFIAVFGTKTTSLGGGVFVFQEPPGWEAALRRLISLWDNEARFPAAILLCLGLWAYVRTLDRAIRRMTGAELS